jgi:thioredoxin-like negative regulator of GroEL
MASIQDTTNDAGDGLTANDPQLSNRRLPGRRQQLEKLIRECAVDVEVYLELAAIHRAEDRPLEAKRVLKDALQLSKNDERVLWAYEEAVLARSMQQLREVSDLAARLNTAEVQREVTLSKNDWANRRLEVCRARLARDPEKHHLRLVLAEAMMDLEMYHDACDALLPCLSIDNFIAPARLIQGKCLFALGDLLGALAAYRAGALRRSVTAPAKYRVPSLAAACDIAKQLGLPLSYERYVHALELAEHDLTKEKQQAV